MKPTDSTKYSCEVRISLKGSDEWTEGPESPQSQLMVDGKYGYQHNIYIHIYLFLYITYHTYLPTSTYLSFLSSDLPIYLITHLPTYIPVFLPTYIYLST